MLKVLKGFREGGVDYRPGDPAPKGLSAATVELLVKARHLYDPKAREEVRVPREESRLIVKQNLDFTDQEVSFSGRAAPHGVESPLPSPNRAQNPIGQWGPTPAERAQEVAAQIAEVQRVDAAHRVGEVANQVADLTAQSKG